MCQVDARWFVCGAQPSGTAVGMPPFRPINRDLAMSISMRPQRCSVLDGSCDSARVSTCRTAVPSGGRVSLRRLANEKEGERGKRCSISRRVGRSRGTGLYDWPGCPRVADARRGRELREPAKIDPTSATAVPHLSWRVVTHLTTVPVAVAAVLLGDTGTWR